MPRHLEIFATEVPDVLAVHWGWVIALGVVIAAIGVLAIVRAGITTVIAVGFLGVLTLVTAVAILVFAFTLTGYWTDFLVHVIGAVLLGIVAIMLLTRPMISAEAITLLVAFYFIAEGVLIIGFAVTANAEGLWVHMTQGLVALLLGALLLIGWPISGIWAIGTFVGVDLLMKGVAIITLGIGVRSISEGALF